ENWTKLNNTNTDEWKLWQNQYTPKSSIYSTWYEGLLEPITIEEVINTIQKAPTKKAAGHTGITNENLKHLGSKAIMLLTEIYNTCMKIQDIPRQWKKGVVYPISKKPIFTGNLNQTRPITLIEHVRKILTKIITNKTTKVLAKYDILSPY